MLSSSEKSRRRSRQWEGRFGIGGVGEEEEGGVAGRQNIVFGGMGARAGRARDGDVWSVVRWRRNQGVIIVYVDACHEVNICSNTGVEDG